MKGKSRKMGGMIARDLTHKEIKSPPPTQRVGVGILSVNINKKAVEHQAKGGKVDPKTQLLNKQLTLAQEVGITMWKNLKVLSRSPMVKKTKLGKKCPPTYMGANK